MTDPVGWAPVISVGEVQVHLPELVVFGRDDDGPVGLAGLREILAIASAIVAALSESPTLEQQLQELPPGATVKRLLRDEYGRPAAVVEEPLA
jgi:hypothetical protein